MAERLRLAHCSDIHLGANGASEGDPCRSRFARTLAQIAGHRPDLMLLAGDLFDSNTVDDSTVRFAMAALGGLAFQVVMIPGNHDCLDADSVYRRHDFSALANVALLDVEAGRRLDLPHLDVAVWGKAMVEHSNAFRPLGDAPTRPLGRRWHLAMGHGIFVQDERNAGRASPIHLSEIEAADFDYIALGHHHAAMELVTPAATAAYSGSPTDDVGRGPTYATVDLADGLRPVLTIHRVATSDVGAQG